MSAPWYLMAKGKGGGGYKTASGPIVSVSDAQAAPLRSLVANIEPVQAGTGDPSPDNVRPISGWSEVNVWVQPTHDPTANPTATLALGQTVYGGTLNVTAGTLRVDMYLFSKKFKDMRTADTKSGYVKKSENLNQIAVPDISRRSEVLFNIVPYVQSDAASNFPCGYISNSGGLNFWLPESTDEETVLECCYPLATPITIPLTPTQISTLQGENNLWADSGDVTLEYLASGGVNSDLMKLAVAFMGRE